MTEHKFNIGQQYCTRGKASRLCTIVDILKTYNSAGELVQIRYVSTHQFMGQAVTDSNVCETAVAMGLIAEAACGGEG
jgi:hypothetical protein